jgi:amino acid transporter
MSIVVLILDECVALSLGELASRYPTSAGPYYWSFQIAKDSKVVLSFITGWIWLIGNWTITLSVNFGFASLISGTISMYHPDYAPPAWELLLIFYAITYVYPRFEIRWCQNSEFLHPQLISRNHTKYHVISAWCFI